MTRYFKLVEIDRDSFIEATNEDLNGCFQVVDMCDGIGYVAVDDTEDEISVPLELFEEDS